MKTVVESPNRRFRRVQTLVREGSPLVKLRNSPGEAGRPPEPATTGNNEQMFGAKQQVPPREQSD
jgi:hypothetical protein